MMPTIPRAGRVQWKREGTLPMEARRLPRKIVRSLLALILLSMGLTACAASTEEPTAVAPSPLPTTMPTTQPTTRPIASPAYEPDMAIFETVWQTVADGFYDVDMNGVDWQAIHTLYEPLVAAAGDGASYYLLLNEMLWELGVSHVALLPPSMADELDPITFPSGNLGFDVRLLEEQMVVTAVRPDSPAANGGLRPGYVVNKVNGLTMLELAQENITMPSINERDRQGMITQVVRAELYGEPGRQVTISFLDSSNQDHEVTLAYAPRPGKKTEITPDLPPAYTEFTAYRLSPEIGYISFSGFLPGVEEEFFEAVDGMSDTQALIIDLRGNPGGVFPVRKAVAEKLVGEPVLFWQYKQRDGLETVYLDETPSAYQGAVVVIIDNLSASSSEEFAGGMQAIGRATIVGGRSPGRCLTAQIVPLESGAILVYPYGQSQTADGYVLENNGVVPDVPVDLDQASLLAERDLQLEAAVEATSN